MGVLIKGSTAPQIPGIASDGTLYTVLVYPILVYPILVPPTYVFTEPEYVGAFPPPDLDLREKLQQWASSYAPEPAVYRPTIWEHLLEGPLADM